MLPIGYKSQRELFAKVCCGQNLYLVINSPLTTLQPFVKPADKNVSDKYILEHDHEEIMALFSKNKGSDANSGDLNAFLGVGTEYRGKLDFVGTVRIDGSFEGEISTDGTLVLGREASIRGTVKVGELSSCGTIRGNVFVKGKAVLQSTSTLEGSLLAEKLVVEQGAILQGEISMSGDVQSAAANNVVRADFASPADEAREESGEDQQDSQAASAATV